MKSHELMVYRTDGGECMVYAPLSGIYALCSDDELTEIENQLQSGRVSDALKQMLNVDAEVQTSANTCDCAELNILLNQRCNFSCTYCYSARGRDNTVISNSQIIGSIDEFFNRLPEGCKVVKTSFSGGGDPLLSFDLLKEAVKRLEAASAQHDVTLEIGIVTNGSIVNDEILNYIIGNEIELVISFDILQEVHNAQRSHYDVVANAIKQAVNKGTVPGIRSTITPLSVGRMSEMVKELHDKFPEIKGVAFESVLNADLFGSAADLRTFYDTFIDGIFKAMALGQSLGITVGNTTITNVGTLRDRACHNKYVITPSGSISACSRIASPADSHYETFIYGSIDIDGSVHINEDIRRRITSQATANNPSCQGCIAKYHCGGGCLLAHLSLPESYMAEYCRFMQKITYKTLTEYMQ